MAYFDSSNDGSTNSGNNSGNNADDLNLRLTPKVAIRGELARAFGTDQSWGQSIGLVFENTRLVEGCIYKDTEKEVYKGFSWSEICGVMPKNDKGIEITEDDAQKIYSTTYGTTEKSYELIDARIHGESDPMPIGDGNVIMWYGVSGEESTPKAASLRLGMLLHPDANGNVLSETDGHNWLGDTSGSNWLRDDLQGEEFDYYLDKRPSSESDRKYHYPVLIKTSIGEPVQPVANAGGSVENSGTLADSKDSEVSGEESESADSSNDIPEPVENFISTARKLDMEDDESKLALLNDLIGDPQNELVIEMVEKMGGKNEVAGMV